MPWLALLVLTCGYPQPPQPVAHDAPGDGKKLDAHPIDARIDARLIDAPSCGALGAACASSADCCSPLYCSGMVCATTPLD